LNEIHNYRKNIPSQTTHKRALTMSKTPKPTNLDESTVAPKMGTQKKAPKAVPTNDLDSDDEEAKEKVLLEKPNEKKAKKKDWTDLRNLVFHR
jgi:hypothetical protein